MDTLILFIVALGLAMDCFSVAIANSSVSGRVDPGVPLQTAIVFTLSHTVLMLLGFWVGGLLQKMFLGMEPWAAFVIFTIVGVKMIREAQKRRPDAKVFDINSGRIQVVLAIAASMDAMLAGVAMGLVQARMGMALVFVALSVFLFTLGGLAGGSSFGLPFARRTALFGGVFMFIVALHFVARYLF
jgi:putative Mn2+ efflux pump MntP